MRAASAHVRLDPGYDGDVDLLVNRMQDIVHNDDGIGHVTLQLERSLTGFTENENHHVGHLLYRARPGGGGLSRRSLLPRR